MSQHMKGNSVKILISTLLILWALVVPASADRLVTFDIINPAPRSQDKPFTFSNIPVWTPIYVSRLDQGYPVIVTPDAVCFSCFFQNFSANDGMKLAKTVDIVFAVLGATSNTRVRLVSMYLNYSTGQYVYDRDWCDRAPPSLNNPRIVFCDITDKWNTTWNDPFLRAQEHAFTFEVIGTGVVYMARMRINYLP